MFDFGWDEMALIGVVSLIVIGPKDLPKVMREAGRWVRRARQMAAEFQTGLEEMTREAEVHDLKKDVESALDATAIRSEIEQSVKIGGDPFDMEAHNAAILKAEAEGTLPPPAEAPVVPTAPSPTAPSPTGPAASPAAASEAAADPTHQIPPSP